MANSALGARNVVIRRQDHARDHDGETGQPGQTQHHAQPSGEAGDGGGYTEADQKWRTAETGGLDDGHADGHFQQKRHRRPRSGPAEIDGDDRPPHRVGEKKTTGDIGARSVVTDDNQDGAESQCPPTRPE